MIVYFKLTFILFFWVNDEITFAANNAIVEDPTMSSGLIENEEEEDVNVIQSHVRKEQSKTRRDFSLDVTEVDILNDFERYFSEYCKYYGYDFETIRDRHKAMRYLETNVHRVINLNLHQKSVQFKINKFSLYPLNQFKKAYTGFNDSHFTGAEPNVFNEEVNDTPDTLDYREMLVSDNSIDQETCKCSYVLSAVENIEGQIMKASRSEHHLSLQHAYDCEPSGGCDSGGVPHLVTKALKEKGIVEEEENPNDIDSSKAKRCLAKENSGAKVTKVYCFIMQNEEILKKALNFYGPLSIAIHAGEEIRHYHSGVLVPQSCDEKPNQAMLLVGYGVSNDANNTKYWIIRNYWGEEWGEGGYLRLVRGQGACGIGSYVATATVAVATGAVWRARPARPSVRSNQDYKLSASDDSSESTSSSVSLEDSKPRHTTRASSTQIIKKNKKKRQMKKTFERSNTVLPSAVKSTVCTSSVSSEELKLTRVVLKQKSTKEIKSATAAKTKKTECTSSISSEEAQPNTNIPRVVKETKIDVLKTSAATKKLNTTKKKFRRAKEDENKTTIPIITTKKTIDNKTRTSLKATSKSIGQTVSYGIASKTITTLTPKNTNQDVLKSKITLKLTTNTKPIAKTNSISTPYPKKTTKPARMIHRSLLKSNVDLGSILDITIVTRSGRRWFLV